MEIARFIFGTALKTITLVLLGLVAVKAITALRVKDAEPGRDRLTPLRAMLYLVVLLLVVLGARHVGDDVAAENYARSAARNVDERRFAKAYQNAARAVELRPGEVRYWQVLENAKFGQAQFASVVEDLRIFLKLGNGRLEEDDGYRFAASYYSLGDYDKVPPLTQAMIRENRAHAAPYILEGYTYLAQKRYADAQRVFLAVLQMFPTQQAAVEGLAHTHYLNGDRAAALSVLDQTARFPFAPEARQRFDALKALYAQ